MTTLTWMLLLALCCVITAIIFYAIGYDRGKWDEFNRHSPFAYDRD